MTTNRNPMGLGELKELLEDITATMEQIRNAMDALQDEPNQQGLLSSMFTRVLMIKLQVQADMEKFK
jgi:hypothetical protein